MPDQFKQTDRKGGKAGYTYSGANAQAELSRETEVAFKRTWYDKAYASTIINRVSGKRKGARWQMDTSNIQVNSVPPETYVAVLFSRESDVPYLVHFDIEVKGSTTYDFKNKVKRTFGLRPGHTRPFLIEPSQNPKFRGGEGEDVLLKIQPENLGSLRSEGDSTELRIV
ncbi:hypothetical protein F4810DRAFT_675589 [Camillea tinctor]|nr:hypothetical protein F4810DRAFT_675589 [Camillea tinctor]